MPIPFMNGEHWGLPYNRTPDRTTDQPGSGGHPRERRTSRATAPVLGDAWRAVAVGVAVVACLAAGLAVGRSTVAAEPVTEIAPQATSADSRVSRLPHGHPHGHGNHDPKRGVTSDDVGIRPSTHGRQVKAG